MIFSWKPGIKGSVSKEMANLRGNIAEFASILNFQSSVTIWKATFRLIFELNIW